MKYPIDAEKYIAAMRQEFGQNQTAENAHREIIPLVNDAYAAGVSGEKGYGVKITISYIPDEAPLVSPILEFAQRFMPDAKVRSSIAHPPRKILYLTCNRPGGTKNSV